VGSARLSAKLLFDAPTRRPMALHRIKADPVNLRFLALALTLAAGTVAQAAEPLSVAQVEKVTGFKGLVVKPAKYDKAARNFVTAEGDAVVSLKLASASVYEVWKASPSFADQAPLNGLGDDALVSRSGHYVCFRKGGNGVCVTSMPAVSKGAQPVSDSQVLELARLAAQGL
jgi:hypothetical protein